VFLNDVSAEEMNKALRRHKELMKEYPREGAGLDAFVDASDTGYTMNDKPIEDAMHESKKTMNGMTNGAVNGTAKGQAAGPPQGLQDVMANGYENGYKN
jgi:3-dehydroquinate synthase